MPPLRDVGEVSQEGGTTIRWTLPGFMEMSGEAYIRLFSPWFTFRRVRCRLWFHPNGWEWKKRVGWMGMVCNIPFLPQHSSVAICMTDSGGREILHTETEQDCHYYTQNKWIRRSEFEARREEILEGGALRIVCRVVLPEEGGRREEEDSGSGLQELSEHFKSLYTEGKNTDFVIRVKDREFRAHRLILQTRIPAFDAMLSHDMIENREGIMTIEDCDPDVFNEFLLFVYSGKLENLSPDKICGLYVLSDKYNLQRLKQMCRNLLNSAFSIESLCDIISLSTTYKERELLDLATTFFVAHAEKILQTAKWQQYLKENPEEGNKLFLKTLRRGKRKRDSE